MSSVRYCGLALRVPHPQVSGTRKLYCDGERCSRLPDVYVCLVLQEEKCTLAVLPLHGHVQQGLPVRHGVVDAGPGAQQLGCDRVHAWDTNRP